MKSTTNQYRNLEELYFSYYLDELKEQGLIESYTYEITSYLLSDEITFNYTKTTVLKTKTKIENKTKALLHKHVYTPDFIAKVTDKAAQLKLFGNYNENCKFIYDSHNNDWVVDIKGQFAGKTNSTQYTFPLNQKWLFSKHGVYVQKIKPFDLFKQTFMPKLVVEEMKYKRDYWKKGKLLAKKSDSKLDYKPKNIEEWILMI